MVEVADTLDHAFGSGLAQACFFLLVTAVLASTIFAKLNEQRAVDVPACRRASPFAICATVFALLILSAFAIMAIVKQGANNNIDALLATGVLSADVEGRALQPHESTALTRALANPCATGHRRSHPTSKYSVVIQTSGGVLPRDSVKSTDYWVFYPKYGLTRSNEVRRACDSGLDLT